MINYEINVKLNPVLTVTPTLPVTYRAANEGGISSEASENERGPGPSISPQRERSLNKRERGWKE